MNKKQNDALDKVFGTLEQAKADLQELLDTLQSAFDDKSDNWKESEKGEAANAELDSMTSAVEDIENALHNIEEARGNG